MKRIFVLSLLILVTLTAGAQLRKMYVSKGTATAAWTAIAKTSHAKIVQFDVSLDGTGATDTLWIALESDTAAANIFPMKVNSSVGETLYFPSVYVDTIRVKSNGTIGYRVRYH